MDLANQPLAAGPRKPLHPYGSEIPTERHSSLSKDLPHSSLSGSMSRSTWESQQYHINREDQNNIKAQSAGTTGDDGDAAGKVKILFHNGSTPWVIQWVGLLQL